MYTQRSLHTYMKIVIVYECDSVARQCRQSTSTKKWVENDFAI